MTSLVVALGGNALASSKDPSGYTAEHQVEQIERTSAILADLVAAGHSLVIIHGNGPQVGNLLVKNEVARDIVPPVPLYWCVAQTQATIGMELAAALKRHLSRLGVSCPVAPVITRVRVDADDAAFARPTKPIGLTFEGDTPPDMPLPEGHAWHAAGSRQWRRVVPSPMPLEILDADVIRLALGAGGVVIACGGGGVPVVQQGDRLVGANAVIDKDRSAVLLADLVGAERLVILTDVDGVAIGFGSDRQRFLDTVPVSEMRSHLDNGEFGVGSMDAKVEAAVSFVARTGQPASIGSLSRLEAVVDGRAGTCVVADS